MVYAYFFLILQQNLKLNMKTKTKFDIGEIPYDKMEPYGMSQEMVDDLPLSVMKKLLAGERTPALPWVVDGHESKARISLVRMEEGDVDVLVMPYAHHTNMEGFDEKQQVALLQGDVILADKGKGLAYYQLDDETNQIISCPKSVIDHNIGILKQEMELGDSDAESITKGEIVTFLKDKGEVTYSIDLNNENGIRMTKGNKYDVSLKEEKLPHYSFGIYGCWVNNDNGLSYVNEEDYTQEMQDAQGEVVQKAKQGGMHR